MLDVQIETGKTHQIRAHLAYVGLPIIGDGKYGKNSVNKFFHRKTQALCSYKLKFVFSSDSGLLNYLNNRSFCLSSLENTISKKVRRFNLSPDFFIAFHHHSLHDLFVIYHLDVF